MKFTILSLAFLAASYSGAARAATACDTYLACGSYEGEGVMNDEQGKPVKFFKERVEISSESENEALMVVTVLGKRPEGTTYELKITYSEDGAFVMKQGGRLYASGICGKQVCTYGMVPFNWPGFDTAVANAGFMRFTKDGGLERHMLVSAPDGRTVQLSTLKRK